MNDSTLLMAFNSAMNKAIFVFEDIDSALLASHDRSKCNKDEMYENRVTLSGLLNCIDGITTREGNIIFFTSNHVRLSSLHKTRDQ